MSDSAETLQDEKPLGQVYDSRLLLRLLGYLRPHKGMAAFAVVLIMISSLLQLVGPLATAVAIDLFIAPDPSEQLSQPLQILRDALPAGLSPEQGILLASGIYLLSLLLTFVVLYVQSYVMLMMGQYVMFDLREQIFERFQDLEIEYFQRHPIGRLVTRLTTDVGALNELFTAGLVSIFGDLMLLVGIVAVLFWLDWRLALVAFSILPLLLALTAWFKIRARQRYREVRVKIASINSFLQEHITGMSVVQLFGREGRARKEFGEVNRDHFNSNVEAIFYYAVYYPTVELITSIGIALLIGFGGYQVMGGALSLGALIAFLQYARRFYQPLADLSEKYNILQAAMAASERVFQVLDEPVAIASPQQAHRPEMVQGALELDSVHFAYEPDEPVLRGVSFRVEPGETLAVVGHTGAGKSTLANLLLRFWDVDSGAVRLDGVDVREWDLERLRSSIGLVLQDVFLFSGTIAGNIRLGEDEISAARLRRAAAEVQALDFIERLPQGFDTPVRERGAGLSVGQKQLLAFARALAFDPRILILDEATSSIDTETEQAIQAALDRLLEGRTSIVIAHRLSTIQKADRILVLHKGEVREIGTHDELMAQDGVYRTLYELQYRGTEDVRQPAAL
ncbi:MAG: ABC transporter ATP-binding protein [Acidobacteriota bacterium]